MYFYFGVFTLRTVRLLKEENTHNKINIHYHNSNNLIRITSSSRRGSSDYRRSSLDQVINYYDDKILKV